MIRIGTDCSGIEAPIQALLQLEIPFEHAFSSDIDKWCKKSIMANYEPQIFYDDMTMRDNQLAPGVDLYVCGFPCQPFSIAGKRGGMEDSRGTVIYSCVDYIKKKSPKYFILENVKGLLSHNKGETWRIIMELLSTLEEYNISHSILNTKDYGIPQNRERLFIVGIRKDLNQEFDFSSEDLFENPDLQSYIDASDDHKDPIRNDVMLSGMLEKIPQDAVFVDFAFKKFHYPNSGKVCPCIAADSRTWCVPMHRYANISERLALQGFKSFKQVVSNTQMKKQIGNSMSVNVLKFLIRKILK